MLQYQNEIEKEKIFKKRREKFKKKKNSQTSKFNIFKNTAAKIPIPIFPYL